MIERLAPLLTRPHVGDIRGRGLLAAVEFVKNKKKKTPFPRRQKYTERFLAKALERGLFLWPNVWHADGTDGDLVLIAPPFTISTREITRLLDIIGSVLEYMEKEFR